MPRYGREAYADHCWSVAMIASELTDDVTLLSAAALHDLLLLPDGKRMLRNAPVSADTRRLIRGMYRLRNLNIDASRADLDRFIAAFTSEPGLLLLRMAHRMHDVRKLHSLPEPLRSKVAAETLHMYTAIAGRLGLHRWRTEMEDTCFAALHPEEYRNIKKLYDKHADADAFCLRHARTFLRRHLRKAGIDAQLDTRRKGLYSAYRKMIIKQRPFRELTDRLAVRILVDSAEDCYRALGVVHSVMHPMPGKLKDYIGAPKENGYRSIHTVVFPLPGITQHSIEIQIRTKDMHNECEYGFASHGRYKDAVHMLDRRHTMVNLLRNVQLLHAEAHSPKHFSDALRTYFRGDHLLIFDQRNHLTHIRAPATVLDYACSLHGDRCRRLAEARVNGRIAPFDTPLSDGDTVELRFGRTVTNTGSWIVACQQKATRKMVKEWK